MSTNPYGRPIVMDNGSNTIKAGFGGEDAPSVYVSSLTGMPKYQRGMVTAHDSMLYIGDSAQAHRGVLQLKKAISRGVVNDWEEMEKLWDHTFRELDASPENHPLLLTEPPFNPKKNRQTMAELMIETYSAPAVSFEVPAILSLYSQGMCSGLALDCGEGVTHTIPVYEGFIMFNGVIRHNFGGQDLTEYLLKYVSEFYWGTTAAREIAKELKEKVCYVSPQKLDGVASTTTEPKPFELPDGEVISVREERVMCPEILFDAMFLGKDEIVSVQNTVHSAVMRCDMDTRRTLTENIVLSGGTTLFEGFVPRLKSELTKMFPRLAKVGIVAPPERKYSAWIGGSILSCLSAYNDQWISRASYHEAGTSIVHKSCTNL